MLCVIELLSHFRKGVDRNRGLDQGKQLSLFEPDVIGELQAKLLQRLEWLVGVLVQLSSLRPDGQVIQKNPGYKRVT